MDIQTDVEVGGVFAKDFRIQRRLRSGGMGSVFIVEQISTAKQRALKLLAPSLANHPDIRERFVREAQAASAIDSDHVVEIVCGGIDETTSTPYLVMELLRGEDLADRVERAGAMSPQDVERVMTQLGHALTRAHAKGIVHRDLKPENVFLATSRREEDAFCTKVLDFGVAKLINENSADVGTLPVGSPAYMAPEQTDAYGNITAAADVWSLGLLAFFLLAGRSYWTAGEAGSVPALLREVCFEPIEAPTARLERLECRAHLPEGFDAWFLRCVERDLEKRFSSAEEAVASYPRARADEVPSTRSADRRSSPDGFAIPVAANTETSSRLRRTAGAALGIALLAGGTGGLMAFVLTPKDGGEAPARSTVDSAGEASSSGGPAGDTTSTGLAFTSSTSGGDEPLDEEDASSSDEPPVLVSAVAPTRPRGEPSVQSSASSARGLPPKAARADALGPCEGGALVGNRHCLDRLEVTVGDWNTCVAAKACIALTGVIAYDGLRPDVANRYATLCNRDADRANLPVNCVSWNAAHGYCKWKGGALPTDQQWLDAARNHGTTIYPWGDAIPSEQRVNACGTECERWAFDNGLFVKHLFEASDRYPTSAPVGSFLDGASKTGVLDLIGNLAEWTAPIGNSEMANARGGSYLSNRPEQFIGPLRLKKSSTSHLVGFRCVTPPAQ